MKRPLVRNTLLVALLSTAWACSDDSTSSLGPRDRGGDPLANLNCSVDPQFFADGGQPPDGIPALDRPASTPVDGRHPIWLQETTRVVGVEVDGVARAYPVNILWWHEIVNDTINGRSLAITYCPLTGSGLVFDKQTLGSNLDVGVSGLLYGNNLVMYDRNTGDLIGPQMSVEGRCGNFDGIDPTLHPVTETTWGQWKTLHPDTRVVDETHFINRDYRIYPYGDYDDIDNPEVFVRVPIDDTRPPKELVLGIRTDERGGKGYPFGVLDEMGHWAVVNDVVGGEPIVVLYSGVGDGTAVAFERTVEGQTLTFTVFGETYRDLETGSTWDLAGRAVAGPLAGSRLEGVGDAYVSFWFAWAFFQQDTEAFSG